MNQYAFLTQKRTVDCWRDMAKLIDKRTKLIELFLDFCPTSLCGGMSKDSSVCGRERCGLIRRMSRARIKGTTT